MRRAHVSTRTRSGDLIVDSLPAPSATTIRRPRGDVGDDPQRVQGAAVADERQQFPRDHAQEHGAVVADVEVGGRCPLACGSHSPSETSMAKVSSSLVRTSMPPRVRWSPKQLAQSRRWMCCSSSNRGTIGGRNAAHEGGRLRLAEEIKVLLLVLNERHE